MKLSQFIPEIKIQPNNRIKVGDIFKIYDMGYGWDPEDKDNPDAYFYDIVTKIDYETGEVWTKLCDETGKVFTDYESPGEIKYFVNQDWKIQKINEIKIQPNTKYKVGDHFDQTNRRDEECIITSIRDGNVYYDTVDGYWGHDGNFRSKQEFDKYINNGTWIIIPKSVDEIKIQPKIKYPKVGDTISYENKLYQIVSFDEENYYFKNFDNDVNYKLDKNKVAEFINNGEIIVR